MTAAVAQWLQRWTPTLVVPSSIPRRGGRKKCLRSDCCFMARKVTYRLEKSNVGVIGESRRRGTSAKRAELRLIGNGIQSDKSGTAK